MQSNVTDLYYEISKQRARKFCKMYNVMHLVDDVVQTFWFNVAKDNIVFENVRHFGRFSNIAIHNVCVSLIRKDARHSIGEDIDYIVDMVEKYGDAKKLNHTIRMRRAKAYEDIIADKRSENERFSALLELTCKRLTNQEKMAIRMHCLGERQKEILLKTGISQYKLGKLIQDVAKKYQKNIGREICWCS